MHRVPARTTLRRAARAGALSVLLSVGACSADPQAEAPPAGAARRVVPAEVAASDGVFVIGAVLASSGVLAAQETLVLEALRAAVAMQNAAGGIGGYPIDLLVRDTASSIVDAARVANELADAGADVMFVGCDVDVAATAARIARRTQRFAVSSCASDDAFGIETAGSVAFDFAPIRSTLVDALAKRVVASGASTAVTLSNLVPYESTGACQDFAARYRALGGIVLAEVEIVGDEDPAGTADRIARVGSSAVLVSCLDRASVGPVLAAVRDAGSKVPMVAVGGADAPAWPGAQVDGVTFATNASLWPPSPELAVFVAAGATSGPALSTFVVVRVLADAVAAAPDQRAQSLIEVLRSTTFATPAGNLNFDQRQRVQGWPVVFARTRGVSAEQVR